MPARARLHFASKKPELVCEFKFHPRLEKTKMALAVKKDFEYLKYGFHSKVIVNYNLTNYTYQGP